MPVIRGLTGQISEGATENVITALASFTRADGSYGRVGDVALAFRSSAPRIESEASTRRW